VISASLTEALKKSNLDPLQLEQHVRAALAEDVRSGDVTSLATIDTDQQSTAYFTARKEGIVAGTCIAALVLEVSGITQYTISKTDGSQVQPGDVIITCTGATSFILTAERTALNYLTHLSGIATATNLWTKSIAGTKAKIRDTRKTIPGLRELEKYAVRAGGGENHRISLAESALIKDNHIAAVGSLSAAVQRVRLKFPELPIEVEADNLEQVKEALELKVDIVLLDNMTLEMTRAAVELARSTKTKLESSGGLTLTTAASYAATGVDYLAVGAITHSAPALDIGLDF
jgi:nicotinate-nucleotide pyrophosphorylase (carboxylating)